MTDSTKVTVTYKTLKKMILSNDYDFYIDLSSIYKLSIGLTSGGNIMYTDPDEYCQLYVTAQLPWEGGGGDYAYANNKIIYARRKNESSQDPSD